MPNPFNRSRPSAPGFRGPSEGALAPARPTNTSVSQLEGAGLCLRKWWLEAVAKVKPVQKYYFKQGGVLHDIAEKVNKGDADLYLSGWDAALQPADGEWVRSRIAHAIEQGILAHTPGSHTEWPLALLVGQQHLDSRGLPLVCRAEVDVLESGQRVVSTPTALIDGRPLPQDWHSLPHLVGFIDHMVLDPELPQVSDHKSAKNRHYGKKRKDILEGLQMPIYSALPMAMLGVDKVLAAYNVFLKSEEMPPVYRVEELLHREAVVARWQGVIALTEVMDYWRKNAPKVGSLKDPGRAKNFHLVCGSMDARPSPCDAYGGCPHRPLCLGRCTHEQHASAIDGEHKAKPLVKRTTHIQPTTRFADAVRDRATEKKEHTMPFGKLAKPLPLAKGDLVFVLEPDDPTICYRANVLDVQGAEANLGFWPVKDIEPRLDTLPEDYQSKIPIEACLRAIPAGATEAKYSDALAKAGMLTPPWATATPVMATHQTGNTPAGVATFPDQEEPKASPFAGAAAACTSPQQTTDPALVPEDDGMLKVVESHKCWEGKKVHITNAGGKNAFRGLCYQVDAEGMHIEGFGSPVKWDMIETVVEMHEEATPGDPKEEKEIKEKKAIVALDTVALCLGAMADLMAVRADKETLGKKDYLKLKVYMDRAEELIRQNAPLGEVVQGSAVQEAMGFKEGYAEALDTMSSAIGEMRLKIVI